MRWKSLSVLRLAVGLDVEANEKEEIGNDDGLSEDIAPFCNRSAVSTFDEMKIRSGPVNAEDDDELDDLELCEVLLPPRMNAEVGDEIVVVHGDVNKRIQDFCYPLNWDFSLKTSPNQDECNPVVIHMKEIQWFLSQTEEDRI